MFELRFDSLYFEGTSGPTVRSGRCHWIDMMRDDIHSTGIPVLCTSCEARHRGLCGVLTPSELVFLARSSTKHVVQPGEELVSEALPIDRYSNVLSGVVKLKKMLSDGRQQIVGLQFAPDFLGRLFMIESNVTAEAATEVSLCSFSRSALEQLTTRQPDLERRLLQQTARELDQARAWMLTLGRRTAAEKVASFILMISENIDPGAGPAKSFDLPLSRSDIADFLGLTIETVSRQLTKLRTDGVLTIENNRHVTIEKPVALASRAGS
jgi:CRP/FNR family transcriptional regulator